MTEENLKFAENNKKLEEQNEKFAEANKQLESSVSDLKEQAAKFKAIYLKMQAENEKLARIRDGLQEQLAVSIHLSNCSFTLFVYNSCFKQWLRISNSSTNPTCTSKA